MTTTKRLTASWLDGFPLARSIRVGCPDEKGGTLPFGVVAHAHYEHGMICFDSRAIENPARWELDESWRDDRPTALFLHEYAHLMTGEADGPRKHHGNEWRANAERIWGEWGYRFPFERRWRCHEMPIHEDDVDRWDRALRAAEAEERAKAEARERRALRDAGCEHEWVRYGMSTTGDGNGRRIVTAVKMRCQRCRKTRKGRKAEVAEVQAEADRRGGGERLG